MGSPARVVRVLAGLLLAGCATGEAGGDPDARGGDGDGDGGGGLIDARPNPDGAQLPDAQLPPDALVPPDAALPIDSSSCTIQTVDLLANGNFDSGDVSWTTDGFPTFYSVILSTSSTPDPFPVTPHSGSWGAWLGGAYGDISQDQTMTILQQVSVPASATNLSISGQRYFVSEDSGTFDIAAIEIWNTSNAYLATVASWDADDVTAGWTAFSFPAGNYAGQTIRVVVGSVNDFSLNTNFLFDTLRFNATVCQ